MKVTDQIYDWNNIRGQLICAIAGGMSANSFINEALVENHNVEGSNYVKAIGVISFADEIIKQLNLNEENNND